MKFFLFIFLFCSFVLTAQEDQELPPPFITVDRGRYKVYGGADYLYQRAYRRGLDFASRTNGLGLPNGNVFQLDYSFGNAYDVYAGLSTPGQYNLVLNYMYFRSKESANIAGPPDSLLATRGQVGTVGTQGRYDQVRAKAQITWDVYNFEIGRELTLGAKAKLQPFFGIRWAYIDQKFESIYIRSVATSSVDKVIEDTESSMIGALVGTTASYSLVKWFGVSGKLDISFLRSNNRLFNKQLNNDQEEVNYKQLFDNIFPTYDLELGIFFSWDYICANIGYHFNYWPNAAYSARSDADDSMPGRFIPIDYDLSLAGLYAGLDFQF